MNEVTETTSYQTTDGRKFDTKVEAEIEQMLLNYRKTVDDFLADEESDRSRTRQRNVIERWLRFTRKPTF